MKATWFSQRMRTLASLLAALVLAGCATPATTPAPKPRLVVFLAIDGTSPKNLRVETVGDVLRRADPRSKVIAIPGKDRGAILPAGKTGIAYLYMAKTGQFASSTFYMAAHPKWVVDFHARKPADAYFGREWRPLLDDAAYVKSLPDDQKGYAKGGKLPKKLGEAVEAPGPISITGRCCQAPSATS